ncbi:hypothetical protein R2Q81_03790 [Microbacterium aquimaris]|uniref:hypothetical protein n=1 Tax=Microbacterium aquimaris TaxID=459816 RepID=UPI002AD26661|nr:hypothetical protein [Microbacterium aquimaris]MDZ8275068.1 hypothetical protein [Microbacterium aquimaris]
MSNILDIIRRSPMAYAERITWAQLIASLVGVVVYVILVAPQLGRVPVAEIAWAWPMAWTVVGAIAISIAISVGWGILAGRRDPEEPHSADQRDREIESFGDRVGVAFLVIGALVALVLAMFEADSFWIGNALFFGFFLSAFIGGVARLIAYRTGLPAW